MEFSPLLRNSFLSFLGYNLPAYIADCRQKLNIRPRKCLNFASPASRFFFELSLLHFKVESTEMLEKVLTEYLLFCETNDVVLDNVAPFV